MLLYTHEIQYDILLYKFLQWFGVGLTFSFTLDNHGTLRRIPAGSREPFGNREARDGLSEFSKIYTKTFQRKDEIAQFKQPPKCRNIFFVV